MSMHNHRKITDYRSYIEIWKQTQQIQTTEGIQRIMALMGHPLSTIMTPD